MEGSPEDAVVWGSGHWSWGGNKRVGRKRRELDAVLLLKTRGHIPVSSMHVIPRHCNDVHVSVQE